MNSFIFHEPKQHGTPDFPFEYHFITANHARYVMPHHWHKEWEIIHILEGTFTAQTDGIVHTAHSGDIILVRGGMLHGGIPEDCVYECFLFDFHGLFRNLDMVKKHLRPLYRQQLLPHIYYPANTVPEIHYAVNQMSQAYREGLQSPKELIVLACISEIFAAIVQQGFYRQNTDTSGETIHKLDQIKSVLEYIELHYAAPITLQQLADVAGMNPSYFCRYFRSITHQSPMEYVNMYRIEKAAQMLQETSLSVTAICMECGFNECSNFIKVFKKYKGTTPNQYRKG